MTENKCGQYRFFDDSQVSLCWKQQQHMHKVLNAVADIKLTYNWAETLLANFQYTSS